MKLRAQRLPILLGGAAIVVGVALGVGSRRGPAPSPGEAASARPSAPSAPASAEESAAPASAEESAAPAPSLPPPDLSGPDAGVVVVPDARDVAALGVHGGRLWWLTTTPPRLMSAPLGGGKATTLFESRAEGDFGGTLALDERGIYWTVETEEQESEPIYFLPAGATAPPATPLAPVVLGAAPRNLVLEGGPLSWSSLGALMTLGADRAPRELGQRQRRITTMTRCQHELVWIEAPYEGGDKPRLMRLGVAEETAHPIATLAAGEHDGLRCHQGTLYWSHDVSAAEHWLMKAPLSGTDSERVLATGPVVALLVVSAQLVWAEAHGSDEEPVALLRRLPLGAGQQGSEPQRLGRDRGPLSALAAATDPGARRASLYWAAAAGIKRMPF